MSGSSPVRASVVIEEAKTALAADISMVELEECQGLGACCKSVF